MKLIVTNSIRTIITSALLMIGVLGIAEINGQALDIAGNYSIDPEGGAYNPGVNDNFLSFTEAVDTLVNRGVSAAVTINVADGNYDEAFTLTSIPGASAANTITFQSLSSDSSKVYLAYNGFASGSRVMITFDAASYIYFRELGFDATGGSSSYGQTMLMLNSSHHIYVENCYFIGKTGSSSTYNDNKAHISGWETGAEYMEFRNNRFVFGENGVKLSGSSGEKGIIVENNMFIDQVEIAIFLRHHDAPVVKNNYIAIENDPRNTGIYFEYVDKGFQLVSNEIIINDPGSVINIRNCDGTPGDEGLIANNSVASYNTGSYDNFGIIIYNSSYLNIYHNSVSLRDGWRTESKAFFQESGGNNLDIRNNSFINFSGGYAYYISSTTAVSTSDHNNYFATGNYLGRWGSTSLPALEDIASESDDDLSSISVDPWHLDKKDLHTSNYRLDGKGADLTADVPLDIDGESRSVTPDIGADEFIGAGAALTGTLTIGGSSPDYPNVVDAAAAIREFGISGPVIFNIRDDDSPYDGHISLRQISGSSETNTVTFQPDPSNTGEVIITRNSYSGSNQTLHLTRASNITFKNLTLSAENSSYSTIVRLNGYITNLLFIGNKFTSTGTSNNNGAIYSVSDLISDIEVTDNTFTGGYKGIHINGIDDLSLKPTGIEITENTFEDHYSSGVYMRNVKAPTISSNEFSTGSSSYNYWGIYLEYCNNNYKIVSNKVISDDDDGGFYLYSCTGSASYTGLIANNFIEFGGTNDMSGIYLNSVANVDVYFNTCLINAENNKTGSNSFRNSNGSNIRVKNNNFVNFGAGGAYYNDSETAITESDYNNIFAAASIIGRWGANNYTDLEDFLAASEQDVNSLSINPWFLQSESPDINSSFLDGKGITLSAVADDYNGVSRSEPPDIGAVEFTSTLGPLTEKTYTIGGDSPDYTTVVEAMTDIQLRGIEGPVVFAIRSGEYDEHIGTIQRIPGASEINTVLLTSESGNPEDVRIFKLTDNSGGPYNVIKLLGVSHFTIQALTISSIGTTGGRPLQVSGTYENVHIRDNIFTSANQIQTCLVVEGVFGNTTVINNVISNGYHGINFIGDPNFYGTDNQIIGNSIAGSRYSGIRMQYQFSPHIKNNVIENILNSSFRGIRIGYCADELEITGNRINNMQSDYGISLFECHATNPFYGLVANNMIRVGGTYTANGINLDNCTRTFVHYNSINITSTHSNYGVGIYVRSNSSEIEIKNNIVANTGGGYAYSLYELTDIAASDNNDLYTTGDNLVWQNSNNYTDLSAWQTASNMDANSRSVDPLFYSESDLRSDQLQFHQTATPIAEVTVDIDSIVRDVTAPDIGAAEFSCVTPEFNIIATPGCFGDTTVIIDSSLNIARGSTRGWDLNGDLVADVFTTEDFESFKYYFDEAGSHTITYIVQQIAGCNDFVNAEVQVIEEPLIELETVGAYCDESDGSATVNITNISGPFNYYWSNGSTESEATGLGLGSYTVAVSDPNGCSATEEFKIEEAIQIQITQLSPSTCGIADGSAIVSASGGIGSYSYVWSNGITEAQNDTLAPGPHYVNVIDSEGCYSTAFINIDSDGGPKIELIEVTDNDCFGDKTGSLDIDISSTVDLHSILWSNGSAQEDISGLAAGIYEVVVEDDSGCVAAGSFQVSSSANITVSPVITPANCGSADGSAVAFVSGGTKPYAYSWSTGGIFEIEEGLSAGVYTVTITDGKGCGTVKPIIVSNIDAPEVSITEVQGVGCTITDNGSISVTTNPPNPFYSYLWSNGETTPTITGLTEGAYEVEVSDENGCIGVNQAEITQAPPMINPICLVTIDTITSKNLIVWQKIVTEDISHYNVYRESSVKDEYQLIASVPFDSLSEYIDTVADPTIRSWRYKLSVVDLCGIESVLSEHHKTIHLTMNVGLSRTINLIWDNYEGFPFETYRIWRFNSDSGWEIIADLPSNLTSYTDPDPPDKDLTYYIEVSSPGSCIATDKKPATYNSSRSNRKSSRKTSGTGNGGEASNDATLSELSSNIGTFSTAFDPSVIVYSLELPAGSTAVTITATVNDTAASVTGGGTVDVSSGSEIVEILVTAEDGSTQTYTIIVTVLVGIFSDQVSHFAVYPNPGSGVFNIELYMEKAGEVDIKLYDISAKLLYSERYTSFDGTIETQLDISSFEGGMYHLHISSGEVLIHRVIIKQ